MGTSASKRVKMALSDSVEFDTACGSAYDYSVSLTQHAFTGVRPYQLLTAAAHLHHTLSSIRFPLIVKWLSSPPSQSRVDSALGVTVSRRECQIHDGNSDSTEGEMILGRQEFKEWAVEVFAESVVANARKALLSRIPGGVAGIVGIGAVTRLRRDMVVAAIGVYALGVATSVFLSLSGMGILVSKRVKAALSYSFEFAAACDSVYHDHYVSGTQSSGSGFQPLLLGVIASLIQMNIYYSGRVPLVVKWVPSTPSISEVNSAFRVIVSRRRRQIDGLYTEVKEILRREEFHEWALEAFTGSVVANAQKALLRWILGGVVGIVGIGAVIGFPRDMFVAAIGVYALGVTTWVSLSLWLNT